MLVLLALAYGMAALYFATLDGLRQLGSVFKAGGGWLEYNIVNPVTGEVRGKSSFVLPLSPDWLIGCGAYRRAIKSS